jgi:hypothetical protein
MPDTTDHDNVHSLYDRIEDLAELTAEVPEIADRLHNYDATLAVAGLFPEMLSPDGEVALRHIAACHRGIVEGVHDILEVVRDAAYEQGFRDSTDLANDEEDGDPPSS